MLVIGVTGGIATGKTSVCAWLAKEAHMPLLDADKIGHELLAPDTATYARVVALFGERILETSQGAHRAINRKALGEVVFGDASLRQQLERILHPVIQRKLLWGVLWAYLRGEPWIMVEVPLLFETKLDRLVSKTIVVYCPEEEELQRLMKRSPNTSLLEAKNRIQAQMPMTEKLRKADKIINNAGAWEDTEKQLRLLMNEWRPNRYRTVFYWLLPWIILSVLVSLLLLKFDFL